MSRQTPDKYYGTARTHLAAAIDADEQHNYSLAMKEYQKCCELYINGIKIDRNQQRRQKTIKQVKAYISRAEKVKGKLGSTQKGLLKHGGLDQVAGLDHVKAALKEAVLLPMLQPRLFSGKRKAWKGVLLFGPPGTGKSFVIQKLSEDVDINFMAISAADIMSKWQGESEKTIRRIFNEARQKIKETGKSCLIFIDEIDSIGRKRDIDTGSNQEASRRVLTELLRQMDGINSTGSKDGEKKEVDKNDFRDVGDVIVVGATNHAEDLDFALRRRFEKRIYMPLPGVKTRLEILKKTFNDEEDSKKLHNLTLKNLIDLARMTEGYSSADLSILINESLMLPVRRCLQAEYFKPVFTDEKSSKTSAFKTFARFFGFGKSVKTAIAQLEASGRDYRFEPCSKNDARALKVNILDDDFPPQRLALPTVEFSDVKESVENLNPSVSKEEVDKHEMFALEFSGDRNRNLKDSEAVTDLQLGYVDPREIEKRNKKIAATQKQRQDEVDSIVDSLPSQPFFVLEPYENPSVPQAD